MKRWRTNLRFLLLLHLVLSMAAQHSSSTKLAHTNHFSDSSLSSSSSSSSSSSEDVSPDYDDDNNNSGYGSGDFVFTDDSSKSISDHYESQGMNVSTSHRFSDSSSSSTSSEDLSADYENSFPKLISFTTDTSLSLSSQHYSPVDSNQLIEDLFQYLCNDSLDAVRSVVEKIPMTADDPQTSIIEPFIKFLDEILAEKLYPCDSIRFVNNMMYVIEIMSLYLRPVIEIRRRNIEISNNLQRMQYFYSNKSSSSITSEIHFAHLVVHYSEVEEALSHYNVTKIKNAAIISPIIGATDYGGELTMKQTNSLITLHHSKPLKVNYVTVCVHWNFKEMVWNEAGCNKINGSNSNITFCQCDMYGNYAILMMNSSDQITAGLTNDKNISEIVEDIRDALETTTDPVSYSQTVLNQINLVFENSSQTKMESSQSIISNSMLLIDEFGLLLLENPTINKSLSFSTNTTELKVFRNVAVVNQSIDFKSDHSSIRLVDANYSTPGTISAVFVKYVNIGDSLSSAAPSLPRNLKVNSDILGVSLPSNMSIKFSPNQVIITLRHIKPMANNAISFCVFWDYKMVQWESSGCERSNSSNSTTTICICDHLTNFAVLISTSDDTSSKALDWITLVGSGISIVSLIICLICFSLISSLRGTCNSIHINLCATLLIADVTIFASVIYEMRRKETSTEADVPCQVFAILLNYFYLSAFMWMGIEGFHIYQTLVRVFAKYTSMIGFYLVGYGIPLITTGICFLLSYFEVILIYKSSNTSCWISPNNGYRWIFLSFVILILVFNIIVACLTLKTASSRIKSSKNKNPSDEFNAKKYIWQVIILHPLLGFSWLIGLICQNILCIYIFVICTSLQGFFIFFFHCLQNVRVQKYISRHLINRKNSPKSESTTGNNFIFTSTTPNCETSLIDNHNSKIEEPEVSPPKRGFTFKRYSWDPLSPKLSDSDNEQKFFGISFKKI